MEQHSMGQPSEEQLKADLEKKKQPISEKNF